MRHLVKKLRSDEHKYFSFIYLATFLLSLHFVFIVYINSAFLTTFASAQAVGFFYMFGALANVMIFLNISKILRRFGNWQTMIFLILLEAIAVAGMGLAGIPWLIVPLFVIHQAIAPVLLFNLDIFLETELKTELHTGGVRGLFLTMSNLAFALGPVISGAIISRGGFASAFLFSAVFLIPLFLLMFQQFRKFKNPRYPVFDLEEGLDDFFSHPDVRNIFVCNLILQIFYTWMIIYVPIYLYAVLGFSWAAIGQMFSIMLIPFIIFQIPGGLLADLEGEKRILIFGFVIMGGATILLPFVGGSFALWTLLLFMSRVGASLVEIMTESYFFKHVKGKDANVISVFRTTGSLAYIVTPFVGGLIIYYLNYPIGFFLLGLVVLYGTKFAMAIRDTK